MPATLKPDVGSLRIQAVREEQIKRFVSVTSVLYKAILLKRCGSSTSFMDAALILHYHTAHGLVSKEGVLQLSECGAKSSQRKTTVSLSDESWRG